MQRLFEKVEKMTLPTLILRGLVVFPDIPISFEVNRPISKKALDKAGTDGNLVFLVTQMDISVEEPAEEHVYRVGTVAKIKQVLKLPENNLRVLVEGVSRAELVSMEHTGGAFYSSVMQKNIYVEDNGGMKGEALVREARGLFERYTRHLPKVSGEFAVTVQAMNNPGQLADFIAANIILKYEQKQQILSEFDPMRRLELLCIIMESEDEILSLEAQIHRKVKGQLDRNHRDYYLREQLKVIQSELGGGDGDDEIEEYREKILSLRLEKSIEEKLVKELNKLSRLAYGSPEATVIRNWMDMCLELPWNKKNKDRLDVAAAAKILDADHDGLEKVKERILEILSVRQLSPDAGAQIICLVGPPGVGKTSIAASVARAMKRKYVRVSLGGVRDEADIRGHRKTYIGAMPGRIATALKQAGTSNPLILLDELDKMTRDAHGDPSSAMLEVLDGEQNKAFRDHYIELPLDLSDCLFIATANTLETVPRPLIDRMEIISINSYTRNEKLSIAKNHLVSKQLKKHGLAKKQLKFTESAIFELIDYYTREAGVRSLERAIASICRKVTRKIVEGEKKGITVDAKEVNILLGTRKFKDDSMSRVNQTGVVNGLAWTSMGGEILQVEVAAVEGTGKIELTGSLGDVMKESARAAITYIRGTAEKYGIPKDFYKTKDIHIHFPEGAVPKDGPSAGITMACALISELSGNPVRHDVAMTGEITLRGRVLPIGGLKEKTVAAYRSGMKKVIIPEDNVSDLEEIDPVVRAGLEFIPASRIDTVIDHAIIMPEKITGAEKKLIKVDMTNEDAISVEIPEGVYIAPVISQ